MTVKSEISLKGHRELTARKILPDLPILHTNKQLTLKGQ